MRTMVVWLGAILMVGGLWSVSLISQVVAGEPAAPSSASEVTGDAAGNETGGSDAGPPVVEGEPAPPPEAGEVPKQTVSLTQAVHFTDAKGQDVVVGPGSYRVEAEGTNRIHLLPAGTGGAVVINAVSFTHQQTVERPVPVTVPDPQQPDVLHLALLLPGGQGVGAVGTYSGVKPRAVRDLSAVVGTGTLGTFSVMPTPAPATGTGEPLSTVGGTVEPDYRYPWVVEMNGCHGVLIDPRWVLTAAHCVYIGLYIDRVYYSRTDPYTGAVQTETRTTFRDRQPTPGVYIHPMYSNTSQSGIYNDIALIKLAQPFTINSYIQTVGLPRSPRQQGVVGTVAYRTYPAGGQRKIFRAPIPVAIDASKIHISASATSLLLCKGDSGSGFVTVENGRATVRGIASAGSDTVCDVPSGGESDFADVFTYHDWILQTMGKTDASLSGTTRVRWSGRAARGVMRLKCVNALTNEPVMLEGPLNVVGVEEGAVCHPFLSQSVLCSLANDQGSVAMMMKPTIAGFTMRTTMANGASELQPLSFSSNSATVTFSPMQGVSREFFCTIGIPNVAPITGQTAPILQRGIEPEPPASAPTGEKNKATAPK